MSKHAASGAGLLEDSALRESENEIIDRITAKVRTDYSKYKVYFPPPKV